MQGQVIAVILGEDGTSYHCLTGIEHEVGTMVEFDLGINGYAQDVEPIPFDDQVDPRIIAMGSRRWKRLISRS